MTTAKRAAKCVTHHKACDCREWKFKELIGYGKAAITHACYRCRNNVFGTIVTKDECEICGVTRFFRELNKFDAE